MERAAIIISVGEEILAGDVVDTNARDVAEALRREGLAVHSTHCVGDRVADIAAVLRSAASAAPLVVVTGGLGPTRDDVTRDGLAAAAGEELVDDSEALEEIGRYYARFGRPMSDSNRVQARRPPSARFISNQRGTAPGLRMSLDAAEVFILPGVPAEMRLMLERAVLPWLRASLPAGEVPARVRVHAHGLPESVAGERIADLMGEDRDPMVGVTVSSGILTVTVTSRRDDAAAARSDAERVAAEVERRFGDHVFGRDDETLEERVVHSLREQGKTLAVAESCTGGLLSRLVTRVPGASEVFLEGIVTYSNEAKMRRLGVPEPLLIEHGAVSSEVARAMADGLATSSGADVTASITGIAGPGGGTDEKPVGLVHFGLSVAGHVTSKRAVLTGDREMIQLRAARFALDLVRRSLVRP